MSGSSTPATHPRPCSPAPALTFAPTPRSSHGSPTTRPTARASSPSSALCSRSARARTRAKQPADISSPRRAYPVACAGEAHPLVQVSARHARNLQSARHGMQERGRSAYALAIGSSRRDVVRVAERLRGSCKDCHHGASNALCIPTTILRVARSSQHGPRSRTATLSVQTATSRRRTSTVCDILRV